MIDYNLLRAKWKRQTLKRRARECSTRGCANRGRNPWAGEFGDLFYLCDRHRALYRKHDLIVRRIRSL